MALGVSLSVLSNLGVSPMSSIPYVMSQIVPSISMGSFTTGLFCCYVAIQAVLLGSKFHPVRLLQILGSFLFGWFVDITNWLTGLILSQPQSYLLQLFWLAVGMLCVAMGIFLYIAPMLPMLPGEGVMQVISDKFHIPLHWAKMGFDITVTSSPWPCPWAFSKASTACGRAPSWRPWAWASVWGYLSSFGSPIWTALSARRRRRPDLLLQPQRADLLHKGPPLFLCKKQKAPGPPGAGGNIEKKISADVFPCCGCAKG